MKRPTSLRAARKPPLSKKAASHRLTGSTAAASKPAFKPVLHRRAFEDVIFQIEEAILDGRLAVGDRLPPERELAEAFQVSRPSVREALRVLEAFGILSARRGAGSESGSVVRGENNQGLANTLRLYVSLLRIPLLDLLEIREALETWSFRGAAARATPDALTRLGRLVDQMDAALDPEVFLERDTEFHVAIAKMSGNAVAPLFTEALREAIARQILDAFRKLDDWPAEHAWLVAEHRGLVAAIRSGVAEKAAGAASDHIRDFYRRMFGPQPSVAAPARPARAALGRRKRKAGGGNSRLA